MSSFLFGNAGGDNFDSNSSDPGKIPNASTILEAAGTNLPLLSQESLKYDKLLGSGNTFEVNREIYERPSDRTWLPYYVAVKHIIPSDDDHSLQLRYNSVMRELRVLTHPSLVENDSILPILAYGWTDSLLGRRPYLVVDYSDHGTLPDYLRRIKTTLGERRELALDIAAGLKALHDSKIIHGDVKPSNALVFDTTEIGRAQMAKLADFGGSIFEHEVNQKTTYGGTKLYNGPEQEGRGRFFSSRGLNFNQFYYSDIYAFGITLWELVKNAENYIDGNWLLDGESKVNFLHRICQDETDGILRRAIAFCDQTFNKLEKPEPNRVAKAIRNTFDLTLKDEPLQRANIDQVIKALADGTESAQRPQSAYPKVKIHPPLPATSDELTPKQPDGIARGFTGYKLVVQPSKDLTILPVGDLHSNNISRDIDSHRIVGLPEKPAPVALSEFRPVQLDIFQMSMAPATPWAVQCDVAKKLEKDDYQDASLQLALCLYLGFGVKPDRERMFQHLESARVGSSLGRALHYRISSTFQKEIDTELLMDPDSKLLDCVTDDTYFLKRIWTYQRSTPKVDLSKAVQGLQLNDLPLINIVEIQNNTLLARVLREQRYSDIDISAALSAACRQGNAKLALQLISVCNDLVPDLEQPSPLHWLIMFPDSEARETIHALVRGVSSGRKGPCREFLNFVPTAGPGTVFFSEHCMELFGTPLHWAVRARKLEVVKLLVEMGSDFNARWGGPRRFNTDVSKPGRPNMSPLDVAVTFHLPEIAYYLLEIGAETSGGAFEESHSAFACVGLACVPFSRYIIHGPNYRKAVVRTIRVLVDHGLNILDTDTNGYGPLLVALRDPDCDSYIVEELLSAGAVANSVTFDDHSNAAILVTQSSASRPYSVKNLELVVHQVVDINALDSFGRNALHYAAIGGSAGMIEVLLNVNGIEIDMKDSKGLNALHFAATFGCTEALSALIAGGAKIDDLDSRGGTALTSAVQCRKTIAANLLLDAGASPFFTFESSPTVGTILHVAAAGAGSGESILRVLLENRPELQTPSILDATNQIGWTALHKAAYFGDHDAVETLLDYGADSTLKSKSGKTALDVAVTLLKQVMERGLGIDHQAVRQKGQQAVEIFVAGLTHIKEMLQYAMDS